MTTFTTITVTDQDDGGCIVQRERERINPPSGWISHVEKVAQQ